MLDAFCFTSLPFSSRSSSIASSPPSLTLTVLPLSSRSNSRTGSTWLLVSACCFAKSLSTAFARALRPSGSEPGSFFFLGSSSKSSNLSLPSLSTSTSPAPVFTAASSKISSSRTAESTSPCVGISTLDVTSSRSRSSKRPSNLRDLDSRSIYFSKDSFVKTTCFIFASLIIRNRKYLLLRQV